MAFVLLGVLTLAACGDDNDNSAATETTQAATETTDLGVALLPDRDALSFGALSTSVQRGPPARAAKAGSTRRDLY